MQEFHKLAVALCLILVTATPAGAMVINFDEFPADNYASITGAMPATRYAAWGVTFLATDDGSTWSGLAGGDPGNWDLSGTNGDIFSGFNGDSYGLSMLFSGGAFGFSMDASRSLGSNPGNSLTLEGWLGGSLVETTGIAFGDLNQWSTLSLTTTVDEVKWYGTGSNFHPYGVDNIRWNVTPEPGSLFLLGLGIAGLGLGVRRSRA